MKRMIHILIAFYLISSFVLIVPNGVDIVDAVYIGQHTASNGTVYGSIENDTHDSYTNTIFYIDNDSYVWESNPNTNYGSDTSMYTYSTSTICRRSLVMCNLSTLVSINNATITNAFLRVFCNGQMEAGGYPNTHFNFAHRITQMWNQSAVTWNNQPNHDATETDVIQVLGAYSWAIWDVTSDVQSFVNSTNINYGWKILANEDLSLIHI